MFRRSDPAAQVRSKRALPIFVLISVQALRSSCTGAEQTCATHICIDKCSGAQIQLHSGRANVRYPYLY